MLKLYLPCCRNNSTFAIRFSYASIAVDLILKIRQYMKKTSLDLTINDSADPDRKYQCQKENREK